MSSTTPEPPATLILGSTSRYRRELLQRLRLPFEVVAPEVDEAAARGESPRELACRLSLAKANAVAARHPTTRVIGSDQTATLDGVSVIGKPGGFDAAFAQLRAASGRTMRFHTGLALVHRTAGFERAVCVDIDVRFRVLDDWTIRSYLLAEQPYDCAGSAKVEGLGIALLASVACPDPTALVGLPLITLCDLLTESGMAVIGALE